MTLPSGDADLDAPSEIAVTVIGGYLGAGKTTLLNHILRATDERIVVLVNDFGSINIDEELVAARSEDRITLANGCICCSLADGLAAALEQVREFKPAPARLVIEASGVADPASIAAYAHGRQLTLDGVLTVVDAETVRARSKDRYVGDIVVRQIVAADLIVVNKVDLLDADELSGLRTWLSGLNSRTVLIEAVRGAVPLEVLLGLDSPNHQHGGAGADSAEDIFETWSYVAEDVVFDVSRLTERISEWPESVVRVKGILCTHSDSVSSGDRAFGTENRRVVVHRVGQRLMVTDDGAWRGGPSRLVVIALRGSLNRELLARSVEQARTVR